MQRKSNIVLNAQARKMVFDVYCYIKLEAKGEMEAVMRTAEATKTSQSTVRRIVKESRDSEGYLAVFRTPGKKRNGKKKVTDIDSLHQSIIKRCIHNFHITNNELPTVDMLLKKLKDEIDFSGSERSFRRVLHQLGFRWKRTETSRRWMLIEKTDLRLQRIEYLEKIIKYRKEGRPIIYADESYIDSSHSQSQSWADGSSKGLKKLIPKGQRVVMVHAGYDKGFLSGALLLFRADTKGSDKMTYESYDKWIREQLLPNLPQNSVVIVDDASYHNQLFDAAPSSTAKKADMQNWLSDKGVQYAETMLKPQLYELIKMHRDQYKKFHIDKILNEHNHTVLRLPQLHPDLNPMEMVWAAIKDYVGSKTASNNKMTVMELVKEKVATMGTSELAEFCQKVKDIEADYMISDQIVDSLTEEFVIYGGDNSDFDSSMEEDEEIAPYPSGASSSSFIVPIITDIKSEVDFE